MTESIMYVYNVAPGETATLKANITGDAFVKVGKPMNPVAGDPATWTLDVPAAGFSPVYVFKAEVDFQNPPPGSRVVFTISGSLGGSFSVLPIDPSSGSASDPSFTLRVA